eukprot:1157257-Pelagomonas_calceolata.AAC.6
MGSWYEGTWQVSGQLMRGDINLKFSDSIQDWKAQGTVSLVDLVPAMIMLIKYITTIGSGASLPKPFSVSHKNECSCLVCHDAGLRACRIQTAATCTHWIKEAYS